MNRAPDCIGEFHLAPTTQSGRVGSVRSGYQPQHLVHENYQTSGLHEYVEVEQVAPGQTATVKVWFVTPDVYPRSLWPGRIIDVFEGSRKMGSLEVTDVLNPVLAGTAEAFQVRWSAPSSKE